ncbi:MAG: hypothetical protein IKG69_03075 [Atopobiaceae bacterium]|nr:hypothetical protein [Atopobiaceae bacterium]
MKNMKIAQLFGAAALVLTLAACGGNAPAPATDGGADAPEAAATADTDYSFFAGQWRGSVEVTGETVYGTAGGNEQMLDVIFADDGTVEVVPLEAHADLLTDSGTYEGTESEVTLHLSSGDITLTTVDNATMSGNAADFGIADFETINFDFYG